MTEQEEFEFRLRFEREQAMKGGGKSAGPALPSGDDLMRERRQAVANQVGGLVRGAGSIGATLLAPFDMARDALAGRGVSLESNRQRRADMDAALQGLIGADPQSGSYRGMKTLAEVGGTMGVGGALARGAQAVGASPAAVSALQSAGFTTGSAPAAGSRAANLALRTAAGAAVGGASAGLVNPEDADIGAAIGAALPGGVQALGRAGQAIGSAVRPTRAKAAERLAAALEQDRQVAASKLANAQVLVDGAEPTVAQVLRSPQAGILERVVSDSPGGAALKERYAAQARARMRALDRVAPVAPDGAAQVKSDLGQSIARQMIPEEQRIAGQLREAFEAVDPTGTVRVQVPVGDFDAALQKHLGRGSFGQGSKAQAALDEARSISMAPGDDVASVSMQRTPRGIWRAQEVVKPGAPVEVPAKFSEVRKLRASINDAWDEAKTFGRKQEAAALDAMRRELDAALDSAAAGLPADVQSAYREANRSFANYMQRFHTGPQASMFKRGAGGEPLRQGGEIVQGFWGGRPGLAEDVQAFRRLIDDQPGLLGQFRSMVTTEAADTAKAGGGLGNNYVKWVSSRLPGLREAFGPDEVKLLQRIAQDVQRAEQGASAGMSRGSNTYQNAANALSLGLLDSPFLNAAANRIPLVNNVAAPTLQWMREGARERMAREMAALLSDPTAAANALMQVGVPRQPNALLPYALRPLPVLAADQ